MKRSISVNKKVGRPKKKGGVHPVSAVRLPPEISAAVDDWASRQSDMPGRSEAIRRLVELGLKAARPSKPAGKARHRLRATELAAKTIVMLVDVSTPVEEINRRRQHLTNGPPEFRENRVDLPKAKGSPK
jgi:hypothetical protein